MNFISDGRVVEIMSLMPNFFSALVLTCNKSKISLRPEIYNYMLKTLNIVIAMTFKLSDGCSNDVTISVAAYLYKC